MPKNFKGTNTKAVAARERRAAAEADRVALKEREAEDAYWRDDDKHAARKQQRKVHYGIWPYIMGVVNFSQSPV